jgi:hypothetical protein
MKREIREFFDVHGLETHKLVERNRKGLDRPLIEIGMKRVYRRLLDGEFIKEINIAREVWKEAEIAKIEKIKDKDLELEEDIIRCLTHDRDNYRDKFRAALVLSGAILYVALSYLYKIGAF